MTMCVLELSEEERSLLVDQLESLRKEKLVEIRHTATRAYRERVSHEEDLIEGLLNKLRRAAEPTPEWSP